MDEKNYHVLFSEDTIQKRVRELGAQITRDYAGKAPMLIGLLKGSFLLIADLARAVKLPCEIEFIQSSTYGNATQRQRSVGEVVLPPVEGKDVIIVEDIIDTGLSLAELKTRLLEQKPASLKIAAMLQKKDQQLTPISADYLGFYCPNEFVVGYGMDYAQHYRNLPFIGVPDKVNLCLII